MQKITLTPQVNKEKLMETFYNEIENSTYILVLDGKYKYSVTKKIVQVPNLYFAQYPVTNKQYRRFIDSLPEEEKNEYCSNYADIKRFNGDDQPVVGVTWYAAKAYCKWLTKQGGKTFRLPTEIEWEWAAGGGNREYPWGNEKLDGTRAHYGGKVGQTTPVGAYPAGVTPEGLMDMAGNVWEWMENWADKDKKRRALRGGSWLDDVDYLRCAARRFIPPVNWGNDVGFRVVVAQS